MKKILFLFFLTVLASPLSAEKKTDKDTKEKGPSRTVASRAPTVPEMKEELGNLKTAPEDIGSTLITMSYASLSLEENWDEELAKDLAEAIRLLAGASTGEQFDAVFDSVAPLFMGERRDEFTDLIVEDLEDEEKKRFLDGIETAVQLIQEGNA